MSVRNYCNSVRKKNDDIYYGFSAECYWEADYFFIYLLKEEY